MAVTSASARNAEIVSLYDGGATDVEIAATYGLSRQRVNQIVRAATDVRPRGRRRTAAVTGASVRGRALLARLTSIAATLGTTPEAALDRLDPARSGEE